MWFSSIVSLHKGQIILWIWKQRMASYITTNRYCFSVISSFGGYCQRHVALSKWCLAKCISVWAMTVDGSYNNGQFALNVICSSWSKSDLSVKQQRIFGWYFPNRFPKQRTAYHFGGIVHYEQIPREIYQGYTFQIFYVVIFVVHRHASHSAF